MGTTVFFSWQSDTPSREGRNLIDKALADAVSRIAGDLTVEDAIREGLSVDKDTKNISGSPPIFQTILSKIDVAGMYVADLTFVAKNLDNEPVPNPNVLIEYGWALKSIGDKRIISVMNEAYGAPTRESLPFDLALMRYPITYNVPPGSPDALRREERTRLSATLESAIRAVLQSSEFKNSLPKEPEPALFKPKAPEFGEARFRGRRKPLGVAHQEPVAQLLGAAPRDVFLNEGTAMWVRLMPTVDPGRTWLVQDLKDRALKLAVVPLIPSGGDIGFVRGGDGCGFYRITGDQTTHAVSFVFTTGEVWIINAWLARIGPQFELNEKAFAQTIEECALFLNSLEIAAPYRWIVGIEGILNRQLMIPNRLDRTWGPCMTDAIKREGLYKKEDSTAELLRPFFEEIFDQCGVQRQPLR